jgi:hypothetical protein
MPYLDGNWTESRADGTTVEVAKAGVWVPERDREGWLVRADGLEFAYKWREKGIRPGEEPYRLPPTASLLTDADRARYLNVLGADLGSVRRDNFFYTNFLEQLKQSPNDNTADRVVATMRDLDFASFKWPETIGGPPPHQSPLPWRGVMKWLMGLIAKASAFVLKVADFISGVLIGGGLGVSAVAVSAGLTGPDIGIEVSADLFNGRFWLPVRQFLDNIYEEFAKGL